MLDSCRQFRKFEKVKNESNRFALCTVRSLEGTEQEAAHVHST